MDAEKKTTAGLLRELSEKVDKLGELVAPKIDYYRRMEDALRSYPRLKRQIEEQPEEYGFFPVGKSRDISVAPPPGTGIADRVEMNELYVEARKKSFLRTAERYMDIDAVIRMFENREEFVVIRLVYLNQDVYGNDRGENAPRYTWEMIAEEIDRLGGPPRSLSAIRAWRSNLVREMAVMMWPEAAGCIDNYRRRYAKEEAQ